MSFQVKDEEMTKDNSLTVGSDNGVMQLSVKKGMAKMLKPFIFAGSITFYGWHCKNCKKFWVTVIFPKDELPTVCCEKDD